MSLDEDYFKSRYEDTWDAAAEREHYIIRRIRGATGLEAVPVGLGAGTSEYLPGSANRYGHKKGDPDLHILETNIYLEVTGPLLPGVKFQDPVWVRPDKIKNAAEARPEHDTWIVHHLSEYNRLRVIHMNEYFFGDLKEGHFPIIRPTIRGTKEKYLEIPADHRTIKPWEELILYLSFIKAILDS